MKESKMERRAQKISIRLLKDGIDPEESLRGGLTLEPWRKIEGARIALESIGGSPPKWARLLDLSEDEKQKLRNRFGIGLIFVRSSGRWFAISFGLAHVKLDSSKFEHNFGLRVVLNTVNPEKLKSADVRTPNENALLRRSQTSRGVDQAAFGIDVDTDIIKGAAGTPKDPNFANRVSGSDSLTISKKMNLKDLTSICAKCYEAYKSDEYKKKFGWIDKIIHIRDKDTIDLLDKKMVHYIDVIVKTGNFEDIEIQLAYPRVYDPESTHHIKYRGYRGSDKSEPYPDLAIEEYISDLRDQDILEYREANLKNHRVHEVDAAGNDSGEKWKISECLFAEIYNDDEKYIRSDGNWYKINEYYSRDLDQFLVRISGDCDFPNARHEDLEADYNKRLGKDDDKLCLDGKLVAPLQGNGIELCDVMSMGRDLVHVKRKSLSQQLSHLFNQGANSAELLFFDGTFRNNAREVIESEEAENGKIGFKNKISPSSATHVPSDFTIIFAVISKSAKPKIPFFSLISLRRNVEPLERFGYKFKFCWIGVDPPSQP